MVLTDPGMLTDTSLEQPSNAAFLMCSIPWPMDRAVSSVQSLNAFCMIDSTVPGISADERDVQRLNAKVPTDVTESGMVIDPSEVQL